MGKADNITGLLRAARAGDPGAEDRLMAAVYDELSVMARKAMARERKNHTLQPTALVNEVYLRFARGETLDFQDRTHFFACAANAIRRILVDHARARGSDKRGGQFHTISFDHGRDEGDTPLSAQLAYPERPIELIALDEALAELSRLNPRQARIVELGYFGGLSQVEIGEQLKIADRTVRREAEKARAWLMRELESREWR